MKSSLAYVSELFLFMWMLIFFFVVSHDRKSAS
jgi:hypothetical protein